MGKRRELGEIEYADGTFARVADVVEKAMSGLPEKVRKKAKARKVSRSLVPKVRRKKVGT